MRVGGDDGKLQVDRGGVIPPLGLKVGLIVSQGVIDILPLVNTAAAQAGGDKIDINSLCVRQAGCIPGDVEGITAGDGLTLRGADIKTACCA